MVRFRIEDYKTTFSRDNVVRSRRTSQPEKQNRAYALNRSNWMLTGRRAVAPEPVCKGHFSICDIDPGAAGKLLKNARLIGLVETPDCGSAGRNAHLFRGPGRFPSASSPGTGPPKVCLSLRRSPDFQASMIRFPFSLILIA